MLMNAMRCWRRKRSDKLGARLSSPPRFPHPSGTTCSGVEETRGPACATSGHRGAEGCKEQGSKDDVAAHKKNCINTPASRSRICQTDDDDQQQEHDARPLLGKPVRQAARSETLLTQLALR